MRLCLLVVLCVTSVLSGRSAPEFLDDCFELPTGFRIYRVAGSDLSGGSYDLCFDGQGRLLVGDGTAVRRLTDKDADGAYDSFEVIATGLRPRGPQGLLVYGDLLYAVGGDGLQVFEGYTSAGPLKHRGRIGNKFNTGGDHDLHTILRGHDGYLYLMAGDGSGVRDRLHITESNSPVRLERSASVFRISPDSQKWECIASGGRNPPSLGMNYLGELFSFDSDMEWHVGLPWYRPVRLNHWVTGGDQGWQEVGAYPPYYIDNVPGILDVGRGSPNWGVFYEHNLLPEKYQDAFLACDYRWKRESNDQYATTGRLVAFLLQRHHAGWKASMEVLARPKPAARDSAGKLIQFALVDIEVAPDGSLFLSDHNQGIWRILYDPVGRASSRAVLSLTFNLRELPDIDALLSCPQPGAEFSLVRARNVRDRDELPSIASDTNQPLKRRLRALRELASEFAHLKGEFLAKLANDSETEIRAQAAWLFGIRGDGLPTLITLLKDHDSFVRRRAAEAFTRVHAPEAIDSLIAALSDPVRLVRYVSMTALAHHPSSMWLDRALATTNAQTQMRALVAARSRREMPPAGRLSDVISELTLRADLDDESHLDLLRVVALFRENLNQPTQAHMRKFLINQFPSSKRDLRWEQIRLLGQFGEGFSKLLSALESEPDPVTQFHLAQAIARLKTGWSQTEEERLLAWFLRNQEGWFAQFAGKGVEFPMFWQTVLANFAAHHRDALLLQRAKVDYTGLLGTVTLDLMVGVPDGEETLLTLYKTHGQPDVKAKILRALKKVASPSTAEFVRVESERLSAAKRESKQLAPEKSDEDIHKFLLSDAAKGGNPERGAKIYENLQCNTCHGGGVTPGREGKFFGPDLVGVARRLTRLELADSLVYPSKQVADRFKGFEVELEDATPLTGFITEQDDRFVTLVDREQVHRLPRAKIRSLNPQKNSLMPDRLLNRLTLDDLRDLLAFLEDGAK